MKRLLYILNILLGILFFASCEEESAFMPSDNVPCYTILVSTDDTPSTRAHYEENGEKIVVSWDKGDRIKLKNANGEYDFIFRKMVGNDGEFFHYGEIQDSASWTGTVSYGNPLNEDLSVQTQEKNNKCCEYLVGEATRIVLKRNSKPKVSLLPAKFGGMDMSLLHIQTTSPGMFIGTSQLKIKGLDKADKNKEYLVNLGSDPKYVFADQGDKLDIYVAVPAGFSISNNQKIEFYFYAYNEETGTTEGGDEYRYIMKCTRNISVSKNEVLKMPLPDRAKSILHITGKAPGEIPAGSMLIIEGWKQEAKESFPVQIDKDGDIDMYVTMPDLAKITNETDLKIIQEAILKMRRKTTSMDLDGNMRVNMSDVMLLKDIIDKKKLDINNSGKITASDGKILLRIIEKFEKFIEKMDVNKDGDINMHDVVDIQQNKD